MGYQVLARKWRPNQFSELVGQEHVVTAITHALNNDRLHHAYLFTGTRGVGKTTIARIFSKSLNCELGQSAEPCGKCDVCVSIEQGSFVDLLEIDAASRTKVEDTRELLDNVQYKPTRGRYKVYLIDEVHMLSKHSFNALLKTLEEPPPHVKFLLATTDPQKLPVTILSRCLQFNLKALSREQIAHQLAHVLNAENISFEDNALQLLARAAQGSMRDALSLTDQAVAQGNNQVLSQTVTDMLGLMDKQVLLKMLNAVVTKNQTDVFAELEKLVEQSPDYGQVLSELSSLLHQVALTQWAPEACKLETTSARAIYTLSKQLQPEHVQLLYKLVLEGKKELPHSVDGRTCLEMTLLRMMSFAPKSLPEIDAQSQIIEAPTQRKPLIPSKPVVEAAETQVLSEPPPSQDEMVERPNESPEQPAHEQHHESAPQYHEDADHLDSTSSLEDFEQDMAYMQREQEELEAQKPAAYEAHSDYDNTPQTEGPGEQTSGLAKTQALLAIRQKLSHSSETEENSRVKKPVSEAIPDFASKRVQSNEKDVADSEPPPWSMDKVETEADIVEKQPEQFPEQNDDKPDVEATAAQPVDFHSNSFSADNASIHPYLQSGDKLTHSSQIDGWSQLIESSRLGGLNKQIALNATHALENDTLKLLVDASQAHLVSEASKNELQNALGETIGRPLNVEIELGEPNNTPSQIQENINQMRQVHAQSVVTEDQTINALVQAFDARIDSASIKAR